MKYTACSLQIPVSIFSQNAVAVFTRHVVVDLDALDLENCKLLGIRYASYWLSIFA